MTRPWHEFTALELGAGIGSGAIDPVALAENFLDRIARHDPQKRVYLSVTRGRALAEAQAARARARGGFRRGPLDGVPVSWKDLYDSAGIATTAASGLFRDRVPSEDAEVLRRATLAGTVCLGKTNMTEFAFSGLGINPTFGTPANACDDRVARCPGGSSSGAGVAVGRALAPIGIGSDTGGSVRVPASWNGLVGLKTTAGLIPVGGVVMLSPTYDTIGPLCLDVADANAILAVLTGRPAFDLAGADLAGRRFLVAEGVMAESVAPEVAKVYATALEALARAGARLDRAVVPELEAATQAAAGLSNPVLPEAHALWAEDIKRRPELVWPMVRDRFLLGDRMAATGYVSVLARLERLKRAYLARTAGYDAVLAPTVPILPPPIAPLENDSEAYTQANMLSLKHTRIGNLLGLCSTTLPCGAVDGLAVGLMLMAGPMEEGKLLRLSAAAEGAIKPLYNRPQRRE
ncbi:MAG: amidase [Alphaproteobacteria bacterium]|nr:amidase [Alphaproteobacteria bacterium]